MKRLPFELVGAGFAALGVALVLYGARRFLLVDEALDAGRFAPFPPRGAIAFATTTALLGLATLVLVFVH